MLAAILMAALVSCSCTSAEAGSVVDQAESVVVDQRVAESDAKAARWAGARFAEAQLPLPAIRVSFHEDQEPAMGHRASPGSMMA